MGNAMNPGGSHSVAENVAPEGDAAIVRDRTRGLVVRFVYWSTLFFFVSGLLGMLLRAQQTEVATLGDNFFYALMTAHGLGAFVGWAAFAIMGVSFWVLAEIGFPLRRAGMALARSTLYLMVAGVLGVVATTVFFGFGASWVFLYPLPFHAKGGWSDATTGVFAFSVLLVGLSIITWCLAILHTILGPALEVEGRGLMYRYLVALGVGHMFPRRFHTAHGQPPMPVIPLAVIALDMIIATLPFAALLVAMIAQSIDSSIAVDPLLAKNLLWFFGHPVVYLLLFPAVSVYYWLIPRYAGRPLVAGKVIAIAWTIAVIANIAIWGHHIYVDFPGGTFQQTLNLLQQPLTLAVAIPSAISLYSLCFTIYRSRFDWNPASAFLIAGLFGWFVAGLSGIVNATIVFDFAIHNTMWIVGHFHQMALMNIGLVIFGAVYACLPSWLGREWYSRPLAYVHLWTTVIGGFGWTILWKVVGLQGAPRRYAQFPYGYELLDDLTVAFLAVLVVGQVAFAVNLVQTLRGRIAPERPSRDGFPSFGWTSAATTLALGMTVVVLSVNRAAEPSVAVRPPAGQSSADSRAAELFGSSCGGCHTLAAANTKGAAGPDLDKVQPGVKRVLSAIKNGGTGSGAMPPNIVDGDEAKVLADYLAKVTAEPR